MGLSLLQSVKVGAYVMKHRIKGTKRYPLVLMLEPLFRLQAWNARAVARFSSPKRT